MEHPATGSGRMLLLSPAFRQVQADTAVGLAGVCSSTGESHFGPGCCLKYLL
ncbi:hypothetical protein C900_02082 [Fulvivirga imtechensis AK7]|uniref:Uncharacterized protein n=1 Tax=Fulvivirga imtechensis AK7 TaxID=1237149 RepID=L8JZV2_9BACT|nr:hypothetical protein C900_02082 [Fulvivirga imtechensis AK7]